MEKSKQILTPALRRDCSGVIVGYGRKETEEIVAGLTDRIEELEKAVKDISPWLGASLSDTTHHPCQEYIDACYAILNADYK